MSANTKYTAAPQRDSFDESPRYSQAPPSYVDEPSSSNDQATLLGGPRSSEDNIPDDFKVCVMERRLRSLEMELMVLRSSVARSQRLRLISEWHSSERSMLFCKLLAIVW